jgi:hypothetical protein
MWQRPKVLSEDGPDGWVHAPMPRDCVDRLHEAVSKAQVRNMEALRCVQSAAEHSSGDSPHLDPRTGAHHLPIVVQRNPHHLHCMRVRTWMPGLVHTTSLGPVVLAAAIVDISTLVCNSELWHAVHAHRAPPHRPCAPFFPVHLFPFFWLPLGALGVAPQGAREWQNAHHAHYSVRSMKKGRGDGCGRVTAGCCTVGPLSGSESNTVLCCPCDT